jgi:predicted NAD-dependent protein-ADP-ribosyltransferase YbiA (DUF1768 family)
MAVVPPFIYEGFSRISKESQGFRRYALRLGRRSSGLKCSCWSDVRIVVLLAAIMLHQFVGEQTNTTLPHYRTLE